MSRSWKRANDREQKEIRRREICDAALALNEIRPFAEMTLADIARSASFTRSNLYKYYACREDLFLFLLEEEFLSWVEKSETAFFQRTIGLKEFSHIWVDLTLQTPRLIELLSLASSQLEKHGGDEALSRWYDVYNGGMERLNRMMRSLFPSTEREDINEFLNVFQSQLIGMMPLMNMSGKQKKIRHEKHLPSESSYFREILCHAVESLLKPWI